ncbi:MAG TPA: hypothetical protein DCM87_04120 [Planctomycetes bacterium]|jgi:hypothetical protein|nr:hypothetical protein [Planctomycetota bacterium]
MGESLQRWQADGWLRAHTPTRAEMANLLSIAARDLRDARKTAISSDWRFGIAYNAALKLCSILVHAEGYRPERSLNHYRTIAALPLILGASRTPDAEYLETCRRKRNIVEYDRVGIVSQSETEELIAFVAGFLEEVTRWLRTHHPDLA